MKKTVALFAFFVFVMGMVVVPKVVLATSCTGVGGEAGTCAASCSGSTKADTDIAHCGSDLCCIPSAGGGGGAGGGTCPASDCQSAATCNDGNHNNDSRTCSDTTKQCCPAKTPGGGGGGGGGTPGGGTTGGTVSFANPLSFTTVEGLLGAILNALQGIIVLLALVFIVFGALVYVTSGGNDKRIELAKEAIFAAMIGLALGIAAPSFLKEIAKILNWGSDKVPAQVTAAATITTILFNVLNFFLGILGVLAVIMLVVGGFMYVTSAGNEDMIDRGKKIVVWSCVGVVVTFSSLILINQIASFF